MIAAPSQHAGTYSFAAEDLAAGPVNLVPPSFTGTPAEGNTVIYVPGIWVHDVAHGAPVLAPEWHQAGAPTGDYATTRVVTSADAQIGLSIVETASNAAGNRTAETDLIVDPYAETGIVPDAAYMRFASPLVATSPTDTVLIFLSFLRGGSSGRVLHSDDDQFYFSEGAMRIRDSEDRLWGYTTYGASIGDRVNILCAIDVARESFKVIVKLNASGPETRIDAEYPNPEDVALGENPFTLFANAAGGLHFAGTHYRAAIWTGVEIPDVGSAEVQRMFWDETGALRNPLISQIRLGDAVLDAYGTAAEASGNTYNKGTRGAFDTVTGSYEDA